MSTLDVAPRLVGEFVVPRDLPIGGATVGSLSGRDRRSSGRYLTRRASFAREIELGPQTVQLTKAQHCHRSKRSDEIRVDDRTGNLVWSYKCRPEPEDETAIVDWECPSTPEKVADEAPDAEPLPHDAPGRAYGNLMDFDFGMSTRCRLTGNDDGCASGAGFLDADDIAALRSAPVRPINPGRLTLLPDLAGAGVPDPDNFEGMTWRTQQPSGRRTLLLGGGNDVMRELRAPAIPPKPL
jgi:hypothetical protein